MRNRIFLKAMGAFVAVIAAATLTLDISIRHTWENAVRNDIERLLVQNAQGFAGRVENDHQHSLQQMADEEAHITDTRVTIIAAMEWCWLIRKPIPKLWRTTPAGPKWWPL